MEKILKEIEHPKIACKLFDLGMVQDIDVGESKITFTLKVPMLDIPIKDRLINDIKFKVKKENKNLEVEINMEKMSQDERERFMRMEQKFWRG